MFARSVGKTPEGREALTGTCRKKIQPRRGRFSAHGDDGQTAAVAATFADRRAAR
jgi:hypothetical protein